MQVRNLVAERDNVIGLAPVYTERGNATEVWLKSGDIWIEYRGIKTVRNALVKSYAIDLKAQRRRIEEMLKRKGPLPFYIGNRMFIQLKLRKALTERDMVYGFFDINYIKSLEPVDRGVRCEAFLTTGDCLQVLSSHDTALKAKQTGEKLLTLISEEHTGSKEEAQIVQSVTAFITNLKEISKRLERIEGRIAEGEVKWRVEN